jgi:hypothetical protein
VFATFAVPAALSGLGYVPAHAFWTVLAVSVLYAATLAPLTTIVDALALAAAGSAGEAGWAGDNLEREGLRETLRRVARAYKEWFAGYERSPRRVRAHIGYLPRRAVV